MVETIVSAYQNKYEDENEIREDSGIQLVFVKRARFKLCNLILDNCRITQTGPINEVADICSKVTECDLSHNSISDWSQVFGLLDVGKKIKFLNISNNNLGKCEELPNNNYPSLKCLILSGNQNQWDNILSLLPYFPSLDHLNVGHSNLSCLPCPTDISFPSLTELNLIQNSISSFCDVSGLAQTFPSLQTLVLSDNPFNSFGESEEAVAQFGKLSKLHVNNITVDSWEEVSKLRWFPALSDVRMVHWDLFGDMDERDRRKMLGALLPNTHLINGAPIPNRESAERWYLRRCQSIGNTDNSRYKELYEKYGPLPELTDLRLGGEEETINLRISIPQTAVEVERTFSIYDTYKAIVVSMSTELKQQFSLDHIELHKQNDTTIYKTGSSIRSQNAASAGDTEMLENSKTSFTVPLSEPKPGVVVVKTFWTMLYQVIHGVLPPVKAEDGDTIVLRRSTRFEKAFFF